MEVHLDASCLVALALEDASWLATRDWLYAHQPNTCYSDFCWGEFMSGIGSRVRGKSIASDDASQAVATIAAMLASWRRFRVASTDISQATEFVANFSLGLRLPDAIHLALAHRRGATLLTADRVQARAAAVLGIACVDPTADVRNFEP